MTTNVSVRKTSEFRAAARRWLRGTHGTDPGSVRNFVYDYTTFTGTNFQNGEIPDGTVLGIITETGKAGPYDPAATDGRNVARFLDFNFHTMPVNRAEVAGGAGFIHGFVDETKLPFKSGPGALDANAKTALSAIYWQ